MTDRQAIRQYFEIHRPELLICNAGCARDALLAKTREEDWDQQLAVNLNGAAACAAEASRSMLRARRGHIVFVSSYSALHPPAGQAAYAAAKAGLIGLAKSLAREFGLRGIRVNTILPGFLDTPMTASLSQARREQVICDHVLGELNSPDEVAAFLVNLHERLLHTSGQVFQLDSRVS